MSTINNELYERLDTDAKAQINQILQTGKPLGIRPKIKNPEEIRPEDYGSGEELEKHLIKSGFSSTDIRTRNALDRFYDSEHGKSLHKSVKLDDLY